MKKSWWHRAATAAALGAVLAVAALVHGQVPAAPPPADPAVDAAADLLRSAMQVNRNGRHHLLLRALRQLRDPALRPLFEHLASSEHPELMIHGLLGLAESHDPPRLDLARVAAIEVPAVQEQVVGAAMDSDLLDQEAALQLFTWDDLALGAKLLVAMELVRLRKLPSPEPLRRAAASDNPRRRALANLLLMQSGDAAGLEGLRALDASTEPRRDELRELLFTSALRYGYEAAGPWAMEVARDPATPRKTALAALHVAMRFGASGAPGAAELWRQRYESETDAAQRTRLALLALQLSPWLQPRLYDALAGSDDPLTRQIAAVGAAVAGGSPTAEPVLALVAMNHTTATGWALAFAREHAAPEDARAILAAVVRAAAPEPARNRPQRLYDAAMAVQVVMEDHPAEAAALIRPVLEDDRTDASLAQAVMLGLVRGDPEAAVRLLQGLPPLKDPASNDIALIVRAKAGEALEDARRRSLAVLVRGGGSLAGTLRIQAAWAYVKLTGQAERALAEAIGT